MIRYADCTLHHVDESDMVDLHEYFGTTLRDFGLQGDELDEAIAACVRPAAEAIERHRASERAASERRSGLRLVPMPGGGGRVKFLKIADRTYLRPPHLESFFLSA